MVLEVTPETTGWTLKQQIKERQPWDELTRSTTSLSVEIIVGNNHLLANDAKVWAVCDPWEAGIAEDTVVTVVFKPNVVICSKQSMRSHVLAASLTQLTQNCCLWSKFHMVKQKFAKELFRGAPHCWPK